MMKAIIVLALLTSVADARPYENIGGAAQLHYELSTVHDIEHDAMAVPESKEIVLAGARLHGFVGGKRLGFHMGLDLAAGGTINAAGFAYDVALFPAGVALRFAQTSFVTLGIGIGANGAMGTLDDAVTMPIEARFELGRGIRVLGRLRASYLAAAPNRKDGGVSTWFSDELEAMLGVRIGTGYTDYGFPTGNGYFVGVNVRELLGARYVGVLIGYSIDMGTPRAKRQHSSCDDCD